MENEVTIISKKESGWHVDQLIQSANKYGLKANVMNFENANMLRGDLSEIGDIVIWRASSLDTQSERTAVGTLLRGRHLINRTIFTAPYTPYKYYQQIAASKPTKIKDIPTYRYKTLAALEAALNEGVLSYPFIAKPNLGSQGKGVLLVEQASQLNELSDRMESYIFQNFIKNDGDWRAIVVGGRVLGVIKRKSSGGSHLNNISQGGTASLETDQKALLKISKLALYVASFFDYTYCGVDIIQDAETGKYYFLEVNSAPEWDGEQGFQAITGVNVADELMQHCARLLTRSSKPTTELVREYYDANIDRLIDKDFHYCSRMYLWTGEQEYKQVLDELQQDYIGLDGASTKKIVESIIIPRKGSYTTPDANRQEYFSKYPKLRSYNSILFKVLFAETIYGRDIRPIVRKLVPDQEFIGLYNALRNDKRAVMVLSTHAINYFYNLAHYFSGIKGCEDLINLDPDYYLQLAQGYDQDMDGIGIDRVRKYQVYLLTHAVIGASKFYSRRVTGSVYVEMMRLGEQVIEESYTKVSLDNKLEYLVCAKLCGYKSSLETLILGEAAASLSYTGNFIIDTLNETRTSMSTSNNICTSEHRNVLYLMATRPYIGSSQEPQPNILPQVGSLTKSGFDLTEIGRKAFINIPDAGLQEVLVRVDTGAYYSTIDAHDIRVISDKEGQSKQLSFTIRGSSKPIITSEFKQVNVRSTTGEQDKRYIVMLTIEHQGVAYKTAFSLADRSMMRFSGLLGRRFLKRGFLVNPAKNIINSTKHKGEGV